MGLEIILLKPISFNDIEKKLNCRIEYSKGTFSVITEEDGLWICGFYSEGNELYATEFSPRNGYGGSILNEIILTFQIKFISDNEQDILYHEPDKDIEELAKECMERYGFTIENDVIKYND